MKRNLVGKYIVWHSIGRDYLGRCERLRWDDARQITVVVARHFNGELWDWEPMLGCVEVIE